MLQKRTFHFIPSLAVSLVAWASCQNPGPADHDPVEQVRLHLTTVPLGVQCLRVKAESPIRTTTKLVDLAPGSSSASVGLGGLPLGRVTFTGEAFDQVCSALTMASVPSWVSNPIDASVVNGQVATVPLALKRNGRASVVADFADEPACSAEGAICLADAECCSGRCGAGLCASATPPAARYDHAFAFDPGRSVAVLFGAGPEGNDTWEWNGTAGTWARRAAVGTVPGPRIGSRLAYDHRRQRMVLFGGVASSTSLREVWEWDGTAGTWTNRTPASLPAQWPSGRWDPGMTYDFATEKVIVTTGIQNPEMPWERDPADATVWEWNGDLGTWRSRAPAGTPPSKRGSAGVTSDRVRRLVYLFSGNLETYGDDTVLYTWNGTTGAWSASAAPGAPPARMGHSLYHDTIRDRVIMTGGQWYGWATPKDFWEWNPAADTWTRLATGLVYRRFWSPIAFDEGRGVGIQFGGAEHDMVTFGPVFNDTREYSGATVVTRVPGT